LLDGGEAHPLHRTEFFQQCSFAALPDVWEFVEDAFRDAFETELRVVSVREAMGFVADALEEFERAGFVREPERFALPG